MPQNFLSRVLLIVAVLYVGLFGFFPFSAGQGVFNVPQLFKAHSKWAEKTNIKPGIDVAGGISLVYEIKTPPTGAAPGSSLAEQVATLLKKRVDPNGVRNLIWRPEGSKLEIQLPRSSSSDDVRVVRQEYIKAQEQLDRLNVRPDAVLDAAQMPAGAPRDSRLSDLAAGSAARLATYRDLAQTNDIVQAAKAEIAAAKAKGDVAAQNAAEDRWAKATDHFDSLRLTLDQSNLYAKELEGVLDNSDAAAREKKLGELHAQYADFPRRLGAIDAFAKAYGAYKNLHGAIDDAAELKALLRGSGVLEFHILADELTSPAEVQEMTRRLQTQGPAPQGGDKLRWYEADHPDEFPKGRGAGYPEDYNGKRYVLCSIEPGDSMIHKQGPNEVAWALSGAYTTVNQAGQQCVGFEFDPQGANLFSKLTGDHFTANSTHKYALGTILDDKLITAPNINAQIGASGIIEPGHGGYTAGELHYLVNTLNAGSLPAQLADEPISERIISPQLGIVNLQKGLYASFIGLAVVAVFLIGYYYIAGIIAFFAVVMNLVIILGILATFGATFTLPSIAGIVLTVGTAVDANVLVFERLREEQHRGLSLKMALGNAYGKAWHAIVDSNMTTVITSLCLYCIGSEEVKGFGLTLLIGICSSLFTALFVTKTIFGILITRFGLKDLKSLPRTFPAWDRLLRPSIDWMGLIWPFIIFSTVFIVSGMSAFIIDSRNMFDIEFASGTSVQFDLKEGMTREQVVSAIDRENAKYLPHPPIPSPSVVAINTSTAAVSVLSNTATSYEVVTPNEKAADVYNAILASDLGPLLDVKRPSKFDGADKDAGAVTGSLIVGVPKDPIDGIRLPDAPNHPGGVAVILRNLDPRISPNEIKTRIRDASVQPGAENLTKGWTGIDVDRLDNNTAANANDEPCSAAVVLVSDPRFPREKDPQAWSANVARPLWELIQKGVNKPAQLQKISNFNPQVAADAQVDAALATILSIFFIMAYIWFRFGNLKYGTATVVALIHDTLATIGAIGLSHYIANTHVGNTLLLEPFRINLTLVAAILTVMSYSMIDTIVVFDRIREIRGKYGHISRAVINDGINQTLSRTLLTCGITIIMVATMYICGGPGIHGFTFVLLIGILVGTYSSIAIAAPILLIGSGKSAGRPGTGTGVSRSSPAIVPPRVGVLNKTL